MFSVNRTRNATYLAIAMHLAGAAGIIFGLDNLFGRLTPFNLLVMFGLVLWTLPERPAKIWLFMLIASATGFLAEMVGVHTGILFGNYSYSSVLGAKINEVPILIGINWFIVIYASGLLATQVRSWLVSHVPLPGKAVYSKWIGWSVIVDGALMATAFDWIMEPAAIKLGFWSWTGGEVPLLNYLTWFMVSLFILSIFSLVKPKPHHFAVNLLLIQAAFFLIVGLAH
jgi:putative membrane protein